ncbi:hypothetical protein KP79_PYT07222 [Mizuhopecten yessoensis]|uniref:Uncharacterized protein n=2 Tax=Mizuhopecten yessoensis TaxID=6573 RepID=A0A210Q205_MIZYE|nr:hypothetical protein KP79_PYT07222 [Mizuhopecten yessoensis]
MDSVYAYAKPLSSNCPQVMTSAATTPESCCQYDTGDCGFEYDGFNKNTYFENCHGRTTCSWTPVAWANTPCNSSIYIARTNYMAVYFYCISENDVKDVSDDGSVNTTTALLLNPGYESGNDTGTLPANSSYKCSVSASCATSLKIRALNLNFTENGGICGQSLTITDGTNTQVLMCDSNTNYLPYDLNIGNNTHYLEIQVNNTLNTDSGYFLLQIGSDHGDDTVTLACGTSVGEGKVPAEDLPACSNTTTTTDKTTDTTTVSTDNTTDTSTVSTGNTTDITTSTDNTTDTTTVSTGNTTDITTSTDDTTDTTTVSTGNTTDNNTGTITSSHNNIKTTLSLGLTPNVLAPAPTQLPVDEGGIPLWVIPLVVLVVLFVILIVLVLCKNRIKDLYFKKCKSAIHPDTETSPPESDECALFASFEKPVLSQVAPVSQFMSSLPLPALNGRQKLSPITQTSISEGKGGKAESQKGTKTGKHKHKKKRKHKGDKKKKNDAFEVTQIDDLRTSIKSTSVTIDVVTVT